MSVVNPLSQNDSDERATREPSMEEILASIRRIISDEQAPAPHRESVKPEPVSAAIHELPHSAAAPQSPVPLPDPAPQAEQSPVQPSLTAASRALESHGASVQVSANPRPEPVRQEAASEAKPSGLVDLRLRRFDEDGELPVNPPIRRLTERQVAAAQAIAAQARADQQEPPAPVQAATARPVDHARQDEPLISPATDAAVATSFSALFASRLLPGPDVVAEMTRELLRPMLKAWLDDNLPVMVERLVRAEIERVARGER